MTRIREEEEVGFDVPLDILEVISETRHLLHRDLVSNRQMGVAREAIRV